MKVKIEIQFDDVNYEEIEEIADLFEFDLEDEEELFYLEDLHSKLKEYEVDEDELSYLLLEDELFDEIEEERTKGRLMITEGNWEVPEPKQITRGEWIELYDTIDPK